MWAIIIILIALAIAVLYVTGNQHIDINRYTRGLVPQANGVVINDVGQIVLIVILVIVACVIAYVIYNHVHAQERAIKQYNKRNAALVEQYYATQRSRLARISAMFYHF